MAAGRMQRLNRKDLDAVLARAKAEGWTKLALLEWDEDDHALWLTRNGFRPEEVLLFYEPVRSIPPALLELGSLVALSITGQGISDAGAEALSRLKNLTFLYLPHNQIGDSGAEAIARLSGLTTLHLGGNRIGPFGATALASLQELASLMLGGNQIGDDGVEAIGKLEHLTTVDVSNNKIGDAGAKAVCKLNNLTTLDLGRNQIGDAGAECLTDLQDLSSLRLDHNQIGPSGAKAVAQVIGLTSLVLGSNQLGNAGAEAIAEMESLTRLHLDSNQIGDSGARALARLSRLDSIGLGRNQIGDGGARALSALRELTQLHLTDNQIRDAGCRAILDAWIEPSTADRRRRLGLRGNDGITGLLPEDVVRDGDAQAIIAAWRQRKEQEALQGPLPPPEAAGEPVAHGVRVGTAPDGRLTLVDPALGAGARDDEIGRELHGEVVLALDRLIAKARRSNALAEWREAAEATKQRLGGGPREVRISAILRIERLRSLREADERRRAEPDPLVEPAEAGVAAALRDAVAAANFYVETNPYLAEQQRRLTDPEVEPGLSVEEAEAAEADLEVLDIAEDALLAELRHGRETAAAAGEAARRARVWLAGSWRNVLVEVLRRVLAGVREQARAARSSAGDAALQAKLGTMITLGEAGAVLEALGWQAKLAAAAAGGVTLASAARIWLSAEPEIGKGIGQAVKWEALLLLARHLDLLPKLGWSPEFVLQIQRLLMGSAG